MDISLPLDKMTTEEKLLVMDVIWDDLNKNFENIQSPTWHKEVLLEREEKLKKGESEFLDWEIVKKELRNKMK